MSKKSRLRLVLLMVLASFLIIQFFRPEKNLGEIETAEDFIQVTGIPDTLARVLMNSCYDCHSNRTRYPWYNNIAPVSWYLNAHVVEGKAHLNFSSWALLEKRKKISQLNDICSEVEDHTMPLKSYLFIHGSAALSEDEINAICDWADSEAMRLMDSD